MPDTWEALKSECMACTACPLAPTRTNVVFGVGAEDAEILFIGEGPGQSEDEQGVPFVGKAGQLLDDMLEIIGLDRTKVYIANVVKCRPPKNRDPLPQEQEQCMGYLRRQTALI
ncbi:MAG: uracil-DNA glycosylase, partial [Oscillibacter sp.]|nr:uracil-DNA glycosylase [Oscillibacter sp.]